MSCSTVLGCLSDKPISSAEIEEMTNMKRSYISACLTRFVKTGKVQREKIESQNKLGPRMVWVYSLAKPKEE